MNRPVALLLLLTALLVRAVVPNGWMVAATPGGAVMALCSGRMPPPDAPRIAVPQAPMPDEDARSDDQPCAFAALGPADRPAAAPALPPVRPRSVAHARRVLHVAVGRGLAAPPPPARGPPAFA